jgi:hypothetical protein
MRRYRSDVRGSLMRRTIFAALVAVLAVAALALGGCSLFSSPTTDANNAITEANVHLKLYQASDDKVQKVAADLNKLDVTPEDAAKALGLTAEIRNELALQKKELKEGATAIAKVKTFKVDDTYKKYADLEVAAITAQIAVIDEGVKLYAEMDKLYVAIKDKKATAAFTSEITASIDVLYAKITELSIVAAKAKDEANAYFDKTETVK